MTLLAALAVFVPAAAQPAVERTLVQAVADVDQNRILVRWMVVEGTARRYAYYDVLRRTSSASVMTQLNVSPIGPLTKVEEIEAVFTAPGRADALAGIQQSFGAGYAGELLALQGPDAPDTAAMQLKLLPDVNYGAALALGLGFLDESVAPNVTYVYEVWGLDAQGFRVERLGRASAKALNPVVLPPVQKQTCVDPGDALGDRVVHLRWEEAPGAVDQYIVGYDLFRARRLPSGCPQPIAPGQPGVSKANQFPTFHDAPGDPRDGKQVYTSSCASASCHVAPGGPTDPRDLPPNKTNPSLNGLKRTTSGAFRRFQNPKLVAPLLAVHDTPALNALTPKQVKAVFDWNHEFEFLDDGIDTPSDPLVTGETYCYQVLPRNLLGEYGALPASPVECLVRDRRPPEVPYAVRSVRVPQGPSYETCEISWQRTVTAGDDTIGYELFRADEMPRVGDPVVTPVGPPLIPQPVSGDRVTVLDTGLTGADAGRDFFYAVRALDQAGNLSGYSSWVPCVPRDIVAPPPATVSLSCCRSGRDEDCQDRGLDTRWVGEGGDRVIIADPQRCQVQIDCSHPGDTFGCRLYRSFDDQTYAAGQDFTPQQIPFDFEPLLDSRIWVKTRTYDKSFNLGPLSQAKSFILKGKNPLPAPRIVKVSIAGLGNEFIRIRFRSLKPEALLGLALYKRYQDPDDPPPANPVYQFVTRVHDHNLSPSPNPPGQWTVLNGATTLASPALNIGCPASLSDTAPFLCYDSGAGLYILQVAESEPTNLILKLAAIGWSGKEGLSVPYLWDGWQPGDGVLDWPYFRSDNYRFTGPEATLNAAYSIVNGKPGVDLTWTAWPDGCLSGQAGKGRPFVVFRKRGAADRWQQLSPPFVCDNGNASLYYRDVDVQPGLLYTYTVIRLNGAGEFEFRFGPQTLQAP